jgi:hypothetical protein
MKPTRSASPGWFAVIFGVATLGTLTLHLLRASEITKTETALFAILEFLFSIAFAWVLSKISFRREFEEGQKRFAIAAYRRVREIERTADRLLIRTSQRTSDSTSELTHEVDVIRQIAMGIQDAVRSSIADWAEIIGDEITTVEKIEELRTKKSRLLMESDSMRVQATGQVRDATIAANLENLNKQLSDLRETLPASLQVLDESEDSKDTYSQTVSELLEELEDQGYVELMGFWEPDAGCDTNVDHLKPGAKLFFSIGDVGPRIATYAVRDEDNRCVGVLFNTSTSSGSYNEFAVVLARTLGKSDFQGTFLGVDEEDEQSGRVYFKAKAMPIPGHLESLYEQLTEPAVAPPRTK